MSRKQNWYIGRYVRAVSGFLPCSGKVKKPLLDALRAQAEEYIEGGGDAAALEQRFGMPQQVAAALVIFTGVLVWQQYMIHKDLSGWNEEIITVYKTTEMRESTE